MRFSSFHNVFCLVYIISCCSLLKNVGFQLEKSLMFGNCCCIFHLSDISFVSNLENQNYCKYCPSNELIACLNVVKNCKLVCKLKQVKQKFLFVIKYLLVSMV